MRGVRGLSLVELIAVVLIVSAALGAGMWQLIRWVERAKAAEVVNYLAVLRAAQRRYVQETARNPLGHYTDQRDDLDVELRESMPGWDGPELSDPGPTGMASFSRASGLYANQAVGIRYGSGTLCGSFEPLDLSQGCTPD